MKSGEQLYSDDGQEQNTTTNGSCDILEITSSGSSIGNEIEEIEEDEEQGSNYVPASELFEIDNRRGLATIKEEVGLIPVSQVSAEQKENHMAQERGKRRQFLQKYLDACAATKVKVDTILIESDTEAKAILDLIPICNIRRLILGTSKANLKKLKSRKGSGTADQLILNAPEFCEVKIICEGKEMVELQMFESPSPQAATGNSPKPKPIQSHTKDQNQVQNGSFGCGCFKGRVMPKIFNNLH